MLRPKKIIQKNKIQKNKNKRELKAFEIKEAAYLYYEEPEQKSYTLNINKLFQINYSSTICDWFTHTEYKELIYDYIKFKILSSDLPFSVILKTGINFGWDISQMNEKFSSINISSNEKHNKTYKIIEESICEICQEQKKEFYSLECSHKFCINCYRNYIKQNLQENKHTIVKKTCPNKDCEAIISFDCYEKLFQLDSEEAKHYNSLFEKFVLATKGSNVYQCPTENCPYLFKITASNLKKDVSCPLGHSFCCKCLQKSHPIIIPCKEFHELWVDPSNNLSLIWIATHTKKCPKCRSPIQNDNENSNILTCTYCKIRFCWTCLSRSCTTPCSRYQYYKSLEIDFICKVQIYEILLRNFSQIYEKLAKKNEMIEKNRILFEEINKKNFEKKPKIKKRAQNFLNFVFEVEKNLVLAEEWSSLLKNKGLSSNYKLDSICSDLKKNLSIFTENINCSNFLDFYVKLCKNNLLIQKICLIKEENDNLRKFFMKHLEFRWNN